MKQKFKDKLAGRSHQETDDMFKSIGMVAKIGDVLGKNRKEKNVWKKRMLTAGLGSKGLSFPKGFDDLPEATKKARLDKVTDFLLEKKGKKKKKAFDVNKFEKKILKM